jgi:hypothetical protein
VKGELGRKGGGKEVAGRKGAGCGGGRGREVGGERGVG